MEVKMSREYPSKYNSVLALEKAMMKRINDLELQLQGAQHQIWFLKQAKSDVERKQHSDQSEEMIEFACLDDL